MFVSVDLIVIKEIILSFAQYLSQNFVNFMNCSLKFVILDNMRENVPRTSFFTGMCVFFPESFVFNNLLGVREVILHLHKNIQTILILIICSMRFVRPDNTRRKKSKAFSTGKIDFSGNFVSKHLSSPVDRTF